MEEKKSKACEAKQKAVADTIEQSRSEPTKWRFIVVRVQMALGRFRYRIGPFDGLLDEKTRRAPREYQAYNVLSPTGRYKQKVWK
jgi:peptidoglycan hydrolase-like protein with peptidoglycan-binding domain